MKIVNLIQGTAEWHAHRAQHHNASDAPAMMGCSPYKNRAQLIREVATGIGQEVDAATQRRFEDGHRFEELARPLAEEIIGEELFPVTGTNGKLSASFDGLTMDGETAFEHKSLNDQLRQAMRDELEFGGDLPLHYQVQMEQQLLVSGADRVLFLASKWAGGELVEERHCWYVSIPELRAKIVAGWAQFEADVAAYEPEAAAAAPVAAVVAGFGNLSVRVEGRVLASNLDAFKANAEAFIANLPKPADLQTDQDFAEAEAAVKACQEAESRIDAALDASMAEMEDVDTLRRTASSIKEAIRAARLALSPVLKAEKESRKNEVVQAGAAAVRAHIAGVNASLGEHAISPPSNLVAELGLAIKGKKSLSSMKDAVDAAVAGQKIAASQFADGIRASIAVLDEFPDHAHLFADRVQLCASKIPEDLRNLAKARIAEHDQREADKLEAGREKIRAEEAANLQQAQAPAPQPVTAEQPRANVPAAGTSAPAPVVPMDSDAFDYLVDEVAAEHGEMLDDDGPSGWSFTCEDLVAFAKRLMSDYKGVLVADAYAIAQAEAKRDSTPAAPGAPEDTDNPADTEGGIDGDWYCEGHPWALQGHDGCDGAGLPACARIDMLRHIIRMRDQEIKERDQQYGFLANSALTQQPAPPWIDLRLREMLDGWKNSGYPLSYEGQCAQKALNACIADVEGVLIDASPKGGSSVRAQFEAWLAPSWSQEGDTDEDGDFVYREDWVQGAWIGYQAAMQATSAEVGS